MGEELGECRREIELEREKRIKVEREIEGEREVRMGPPHCSFYFDKTNPFAPPRSSSQEVRKLRSELAKTKEVRKNGRKLDTFVAFTLLIYSMHLVL